MGLLLIFPWSFQASPGRKTEKEKVTRSYTFRNENVTLEIGSSSSSSSQGLSRVFPEQIGAQGDSTNWELDLPGLKRGELDLRPEKRNVEKMDE